MPRLETARSKKPNLRGPVVGGLVCKLGVFFFLFFFFHVGRVQTALRRAGAAAADLGAVGVP